MEHRLKASLVAVLLSAPLLMAFAGGWATITVRDLPDYVVAGQPTELAFTIRQHGVEPMNDLVPVIDAVSQAGEKRFKAKRGRGPGEYVVAVTLPDAGDWKLVINSGFGDSKLPLMPVRSIAQGTSAPAALSDFDRGQRLFVAKGCVMCHTHKAVRGSGHVDVGPELTVPRLASDYLKKFLADPSIQPPRGDMKMPNLQLSAKEIDALVAFVNAEKAGN
jgi:mono/diheme cytochrome c family protein